MPVIEVNGLTKTFRTYKKQPGFGGAIKGLFHRQYEQTIAVNDVSFKIEPGELVGFLGPNGAGKTTTLKIALGLMRPSAGSVELGVRGRQAVGYLPENAYFYDYLSGRELLIFCGRLFGLSRRRRVGIDLVLHDDRDPAIGGVFRGGRFSQVLVGKAAHL